MEKRKHTDGVLVILVFQRKLNENEMLFWQLAEIKQVQFFKYVFCGFSFSFG